MSELAKIEYQILMKFYEINKPVTKHELLTNYPNLNENTTAAFITTLLTKRYLEIAERGIFQTSLARAYKPRLSLLSFLQAVYGYSSVERLIKRAVRSIKNADQLDRLLVYINEKKDFQTYHI